MGSAAAGTGSGGRVCVHCRALGASQALRLLGPTPDPTPTPSLTADCGAVARAALADGAKALEQPKSLLQFVQFQGLSRLEHLQCTV